MRRKGCLVTVCAFAVLLGCWCSVDAANVKKNPVVLDANNKLVGEVVGVGSSALFPQQPVNGFVALNVPGESIVVPITSSSIGGNAQLFFDQPNCVGQPYFWTGGVIGQPHLFPIVGVSGTTLYGPRPNSGPVAVTFVSTLDLTNACLSTSFSGGIIADPMVDLGQRFTPPFRFVNP